MFRDWSLVARGLIIPVYLSLRSRPIFYLMHLAAGLFGIG